MFKDEYRKAMSFPVSEDLLKKTGQQMRRKRPRNTALPKLIATAAAICLLVVEGAGLAGISGGRNAGASDLSMNRMPAAQEGGQDAAAGNAAAGDAQENGSLRSAAPAQGGLLAAGSPEAYSLGGEASAEAPIALDGTMKHSGSGFEGLMAYSIEEARNSNNPGMEVTSPETLPFYQNLAVSDGAGIPQGEYLLIETELKSYAQELVTALGGNSDAGDGKLSCFTNTDGEDKPYAYSLGNVTVRGNGEVSVYLDDKSPAIRPEGKTPKEQLENASAVFYEQYQTLFHFTDPQFSTYLDYTFDGVPVGLTIAYDGSGTLEDQIYSYNFDEVYLGVIRDEKDPEAYRLVALHFHIAQINKRVGEYPAISVAQAQEILLAGTYQTTVPYDTDVTASSVKSAELVYWTDSMSEYFLPYYRFLVEVEPDSGVSVAEGLITYGAYYVPAISEQYLTVAAEEP